MKITLLGNLKVEFDSKEEDFTNRLNSIPFDGFDGVELVSARFDGDQQ